MIMMGKQLWSASQWRAGIATLSLAVLCSASLAKAPEPLVKVDGAWVRPAVKGQSGTGGFMRLTSSVPLTLVGFKTQAATSAELHEMSMQGDVMRMRPVDALPLPAGQTVSLQPGGHHLMLMGLKQALPAGQSVPLTLLLRDADGKEIQQNIDVPVRLSAPGGAPAESHDHGEHEHHHDH